MKDVNSNAGSQANHPAPTRPHSRVFFSRNALKAWCAILLIPGAMLAGVEHVSAIDVLAIPDVHALKPSEQIVVTYDLVPAEKAENLGDARSNEHLGPLTLQLAERYGLTPIKEWPITVLGRQCVIYRVTSGVAVGSVIDRLNHDAQVSSAQVLNQFYATLSP